MACIYHQVPRDMTGETLYPLSKLETFAPELYERHIAKYDDHPSRKRIPYQRLPKLNCLRKEVLNFSPLHPHLVYEAWQTLGVTLPDATWYQLPVEAVAHLPAIVYQPGRVSEGVEEVHVRWLEPYRESAALSDATIKWYAQLHEAGRRGGWFAHTPHVLVRGAVSVKGATVITWRDPL